MFYFTCNHVLILGCVCSKNVQLDRHEKNSSNKYLFKGMSARLVINAQKLQETNYFSPS